MGGETRRKSKEPARDINTGIKIQCVMTRQGITQKDLAVKAGVNFSTINRIIWGTRTSAAVQLVIAQALGFESWEELKSHREVV